MRDCPNCHRHITVIYALTADGDSVCPYCGHVDEQNFICHPPIWMCGCGKVLSVRTVLRPMCPGCKKPMRAAVDYPSQVRGVGTGNRDLELGLMILLKAQKNESDELRVEKTWTGK